MRISDWSSDVCSSDLFDIVPRWRWQQEQSLQAKHQDRQARTREQVERFVQFFERTSRQAMRTLPGIADRTVGLDAQRPPRSEEHSSELQSLMRNSYAVLCLKKNISNKK